MSSFRCLFTFQVEISSRPLDVHSSTLGERPVWRYKWSWHKKGILKSWDGKCSPSPLPFVCSLFSFLFLNLWESTYKSGSSFCILCLVKTCSAVSCMVIVLHSSYSFWYVLLQLLFFKIGFPLQLDQNFFFFYGVSTISYFRL